MSPLRGSRCGLEFPALTGWANEWRAYGARDYPVFGRRAHNGDFSCNGRKAGTLAARENAVRRAMHGWRHFGAFAAACLVLLLLSGAASGQEAAVKKRVAVLNFDGPGTGTDAPTNFAGDVGKGVSVQLIQKLVDGGKFTVVDRSALEKALEEQTEADSNSMGGAKDAYGLAAKTGRMLRLDAMIIGAVTRYGADDKGKAGGGSGLMRPGMRTRQSKAIVEITARVFNVSSAEVMTEFKSTGESAHTGTVTTISVRGQPESTYESLGTEFTGSLLAEATRNAVEQLAIQLNLFAEKIPSGTAGSTKP
jgi:curli biogenesis system outer membrane secretion channel CsgG